MYLWEVQVENVLGVEKFKMNFQPHDEAGWHVLIGENGSGKTTILKCIASALLGERMRLFFSGDDIVRRGAKEGTVTLAIAGNPDESPFRTTMKFEQMGSQNGHVSHEKDAPLEHQHFANRLDHIFALGYGTYRNFRGIDLDLYKQKGIRNFQTLFEDQQGLASVNEWFKDRIVDSQRQDDKIKGEASFLLDLVHWIINKSSILPSGFQMMREVTPDGPFVADSTGFQAPAQSMSEGVRSMLALTLDILINMIEKYDFTTFSKSVDREKGSVNLPGIVLIDEIDAHLHPSWQTEIGRHLMHLFPKIQFIVTTHSPLICRAAERGSVWKLPALGTGEVQEVTGIEKDRLVFGNVLDAFGTELFGSEPVRFRKNDEKKSRLGKLRMRSALGVLTEEERAEKLRLEMTLATDDTAAI